MKEGLKKIAAEANRAYMFTTSRAITGSGYLLMFTGGQELYTGKTVNGLVHVGCGLLLCATDYVLNRPLIDVIPHDERMVGARNVVEKLGLTGGGTTEPLYTSLDGERVIYKPETLVVSFNDEPGSIQRSVVRTLAHSRTRELDIEEIEKLRRAEALLALIPEENTVSLGPKESDYVEELHYVVRAAEQRFRTDN